MSPEEEGNEPLRAPHTRDKPGEGAEIGELQDEKRISRC